MTNSFLADVGLPLLRIPNLRQVDDTKMRCVVVVHFQYGGESSKIRQILTEHSVKVRPFRFPFTIGKCNLIYSECVKVFFVRICRVFYGSQGQTRSLFFCM